MSIESCVVCRICESRYFIDTKNWIASRDALSNKDRLDWIMGENNE